jgi:hypothetical protein
MLINKNILYKLEKELRAGIQKEINIFSSFFL